MYLDVARSESTAVASRCLVTTHSVATKLNAFNGQSLVSDISIQFTECCIANNAGLNPGGLFVDVLAFSGLFGVQNSHFCEEDAKFANLIPPKTPTSGT